MEIFFKLWLAILASAFAAWFWSFLSWTILPIHKYDWKALPDENAALKNIQSLSLPHGNYAFPFATDNATRKDPAFIEKWKTGPAGTLSIWRMPNMAANMLLTIVICLIASALIGYLLAMALPAGSTFSKVMQVAATAGILTHTIAILPGMVWFQASPGAWVSSIVDGLVKGLATGAIFAAMWPNA